MMRGMAHLHPPLSLTRIQAALRSTTETLAGELGRPTEHPPSWNATEWHIARATASLHGVSPLLATRLRWSGPAGWQQFLREQRAHTVARRQRLAALESALEVQCVERGVPFVGLKGIQLHALGLYQPGERPMADLDVLVRPADLAPMEQALKALGYRPVDTSWKELVFEAADGPIASDFGEGGANRLKVDVHWHVSEPLPRRLVEITPLLLRAPLRAGCNPYPGHAELMCHLLLHAAGEMVLRTLRLIQLEDIARLSKRMSAADWATLLELQHRSPGLAWALPPLALVARYYEVVPPAVLASLRACASGSLRRIARRAQLWQLSYSSLRRRAFPGLGWTAGVERLAYLAARTSMGTRALLGSGGTVGTSPPQAARAGAGGWRRLQRVRPATLYAVHAALAEAP